MHKTAIIGAAAAVALAAAASQAVTYEIGRRGNTSDYPFNGC
jgi:hypothetical protein